MKTILGKTIKQNVVDLKGTLLVSKNTLIRQEHIDLMKHHKIDEFSLVVEAGNGMQTSHTNLLALQAVDQSLALFKSIKQTRKVPVIDFKNQIVPTVQKIAKDPNIFRLFEAIKAQDDYIHEHNIGVGILSTLIGKWLNMAETELNMLSLAATLHNVGKVRIPIDILNKPDKLSNDEYHLMKQHTVTGYEMLKSSVGLSHRTALVALQHHEREDGSGYPFGSDKDKIDYFSKIVAVADMFHAMFSKRPYHEPIPFFEIVSQMRKETFGKLEPFIVSIFIKNITKRMIGKKALLTDGRSGEIVFINPNNEINPLIKLKDGFLDLSYENHIRIQEVMM